MTFEEIQTSRLVLRIFTQETYDALFENYSENEICNYLGLSSKTEFLKEKTKYQNGLTTFNKKLLYFQLIDKLDNTIIGWCGYHTWYVDHARAEIGCGLHHEKHKKKGLMQEALKPVLKYGFEQMKLNRIEAMISPNNAPSLNLIKKLNFTEEGNLREHYIKDGQTEDSLVFSLLKSEF